jgi:uracil-DNA glycosylase
VNTEPEFNRLEHIVAECRRCPRLAEWRELIAQKKVRRFQKEEYWGRPVPAFGRPNAALFIIGLAPAAHGGNRTGRIFTGDRSGDWLYDALYRFGFANQPYSRNREDGLQLRNCLISAVIRCAPPDNKPLPEEIENCRDYLSRELQLAERKQVIVVLGQIAFRAFLKTWPAAIGLSKEKFCHGGEWNISEGLTLIASFHPSQQNTQTGKLTHTMFDSIFRKAQRILGHS